VNANGSIIGWGHPSPALDVPEPNSEFVAVETDAEIGFSVGLKQDGSLVGWGYGGALYWPPPASPIIEFDIGGTNGHASVVALHEDGTLSSFGGEGFVSVSAGGLATMAILGKPTAGIGPLDAPRPEALTFAPNPFRNSTEIVGGGSLMSIYSASGRHVRSLIRLNSWDGRNASGIEVPAGVYVVVSGNVRGRVIKLR
jgi:hypothetical protein